MADLQIVYREGYCKYHCENYRITCHTCWAEEEMPYECPYFDKGKTEGPNGVRIIPFGDCMNAAFRYNYKGISTKNYEIEKDEGDNFNLHLRCMQVTIGKRTYECEKVVLDGKVIYNDYDPE